MWFGKGKQVAGIFGSVVTLFSGAAGDGGSISHVVTSISPAGIVARSSRNVIPTAPRTISGIVLSGQGPLFGMDTCRNRGTASPILEARDEANLELIQRTFLDATGRGTLRSLSELRFSHFTRVTLVVLHGQAVRALPGTSAFIISS